MSFIDLQRQFANHLRDPGQAPPPAGMDARRLTLYRELFFNNVLGLLAGNFPVLRSCHDDEAWRALVRDWFAGHRARTPLFPQMGGEFVAWLQARQQSGEGDPPWFAELAHYEYMETLAKNHDVDLDDLACDPDGDLLAGIPLRSPLAFALAYRYPVHRIARDAQPAAGPPPAEPTCLIVVRDRSEKVGFLATNVLTLQLLDLLDTQPALTGAAALDRLAAASGIDAATMRDAGAALLQQLRARDIVLGTRLD